MGSTRDRPVFGDLRHDQEMRDNQIKGNLLGRRAWYVRDRYGAAALEALIAAVPESARKFLVDRRRSPSPGIRSA